MKEHHLSIRDLVPSPDPSALTSTDPAKSHAAAQAYLGRKYKSFRSELSLSIELSLNGENYQISGRIDGIRRVKNGYCIYEIKPVRGNPKHWLRHIELLRARWQLMLYASLFQSADSPYRGKLRQAVLLLIGDNGRTCEEEIDHAGTTDAIERRLRSLHALRIAVETRNHALASLDAVIEKDCKTDRPLQTKTETALSATPLIDRVLLMLPPGTGKTRIALRFALRSEQKLNQQIFWITAKAAGRLAIIEEIERLNSLGLPITYSWKTSAERLCDCDFSPEVCPLRQRTQTVLFFDDSAFEDFEHDSQRCCPHQLQQHRQNRTHIVIADINYLLNSSNLRRQSAVLVIDEVQHFVNRIIENSRVSLSLRQLKNLLSRLPAAQREKFTELISPEWIDEELAYPEASRWIELSEILRLNRIENEIADQIHCIAHLLLTIPDDYHLTWYSTVLDSGWIGFCQNPETLVTNALDNFPVIAALSGSLPTDKDSLQFLLPGFNDFLTISPEFTVKQIVSIVPLLDFRFPISQTDISGALEALMKLQSVHNDTIAVFTQNRESSIVISEALRVRGCITALDTDIDPEWDFIKHLKPDFLLIPLGSSFSESVNPPHGLFGCAVVLAPGHSPQDQSLVNIPLRSASDSLYLQSVRNSVSRIIQAVGRVQRSPSQFVPVYLLNQAFVRPEFTAKWPQHWYHDLQDIIFDSLECAVDYALLSLSDSS